MAPHISDISHISGDGYILAIALLNLICSGRRNLLVKYWNELPVIVHQSADFNSFRSNNVRTSNVNIAQISNVSNFSEHKLYFIFI